MRAQTFSISVITEALWAVCYELENKRTTDRPGRLWGNPSTGA
jgi:hypothetical protein